ncbi:MAG: hypothetical protein ACYTGL_30885 [Planctomycetota bacterium]|jgi:uncharacterized membrane protein
MSHQERASIVAIVTNLLLNLYVIVRVGKLFSTGALSGDDAVMVWAQTIVWIIPAAIALTIVLNHVIAFAARDQDLKKTVDERDRQFQLRGMGVLLMSVGLGFMTMIVLLATGWTAVAGLTLLYFSIAVGDLLGSVVRLASYRIGGMSC